LPRFAANLSWLFTEHPFADRFAHAARAGFRAIECLFPYELPAEIMAASLARHGLEPVLINLPPGDFAAGERGLAALPGREAEFEQSLVTGLAYAQRIGCPRVHVMAGLVPEDLVPARVRACFVANLRRAVERAADLGITVLIEPINPRDMPGYGLTHPDQALDLILEIGVPALRLQLDLYHCQIVAGDLERRIEAALPWIGHVQIAAVPDRGEPDGGEIHYPHLFGVLDRLGYGGWVGCEYRPRGRTEAGLGWLAPWLSSGVRVSTESAAASAGAS
jgi:hydroxypyruvate isomerase